LVLFKFKSAPDIPTEPSICATPPDVVSLYQVATVPVPAPAVPVPFAIAFSVNTPPAAAGANVALQVNVAKRICAPMAVSGFAAWVPEYIFSNALAPQAVVSASIWAFFNTAEYFRLEAMIDP
jgi:hypothetical protein